MNSEFPFYKSNPVFISDTNARTGLRGFAIQAIENTVIASIQYENISTVSSNTLAGETILAGHIWYLPSISAITLTSGALFVYQELP